MPRSNNAGSAYGRLTARQTQQNGQLVNSLAEMELEHVSPEYKKEGPDWFAIFNPAVRRVLDVHLMQSLEHGSVVCCVRFSLDGRLVATGCNRSAQIFDVSTGALIAKLQDSNASEDADLYIRSVCFSPDSRLLASGAEDKIIRVSMGDEFLVAVFGLRYVDEPRRYGTLPVGLSSTSSPGTSRTSTRSTSRATAD